jgi:hypothetical protein
MRRIGILLALAFVACSRSTSSEEAGVPDSLRLRRLHQEPGPGAVVLHCKDGVCVNEAGAVVEMAAPQWSPMRGPVAGLH